jgi:trimeric autotransporter adhesin
MHRTSLVVTMVLSSLFGSVFMACGAGDNVVGTEAEPPDGGGAQTDFDAADSCSSCGAEPNPTEKANLVLSSTEVCLSARVGQRSGAKTFTVANTGTGPSGPLAVTLAGAAAQSFAITSNTCTGAGLAAGGTCSVAAVYAPTAAHDAAENATLVVTDAETAASAPLVGNDVGKATGAPMALSFGEVSAGSTSAEVPVRVTSTSACESPWTAVIDNSNFVISSNTCAGRAIKTGDICQIGVQFSPPANEPPSAVAGQLTLTTDDTSVVAVTLSGIIVKDTPSQPVPLSVSATAFDFGEITVGQSGTANLTVVSSGVAVTASLDLPSSSAFTVTANTCYASLTAGASCNVQVQFSPALAGAYLGSLRLTDGQTTVVVSLRGQGIAAPVTEPFIVAPTALDFGVVAIGKSAYLSLNVFALAPYAGPFTLVMSGGAGSALAIDSNGCAAKVPAGGSCSVGIRFSPTQVSTAAGQLHVTDGTYDVPVAVTGKGAMP